MNKYIQFSKTDKFRIWIIPIKNFYYFEYTFGDIQDLFLFISLSAFLPSLSVLKISQENEETIIMDSVNKEIKVISMLLVILLTII